MENTSGLSQKRAEMLLKNNGYNELPSQKNKNSFLILLKVISEPMLLLLIISGLIYFFLGEIQDSLMLLSFVLVVIGITFYQERKTEKTLIALKELSSPRVLVIRDNEQKIVPGREIVKNDIIILHEGNRVPADAVILDCENLAIDESLLTGESIPVRKTKWDMKLKIQRPGGNDLPFIYSGSMVVSGQGIARIIATGSNTEIGKIGRSIEAIKEEDTLLHKETAKIVRLIVIFGALLCLLVLLIYIFIKDNIVQGLLASLTLGMAILPEEFPVVLIIFLTLGAWRISKNKVLTRHPAAIETLGATTILCTDKTGTLTLNKMRLISLYSQNSFCGIKNYSTAYNLPEKFHSLLEYGILASQKDPFDPIEKELNKTGNLFLKNTKHLHQSWSLKKEYPLSKNLLAISRVWQSPDQKNFIIASKGAPEAIFNLCHFNSAQKKEVLQEVIKMSNQGLRILGVARAKFSQDSLPKNQHDFSFQFIGLLGFIDPARTTAPQAIKEAYNAGIRVIMITGDYPGTAQFIAKKIGINNPELYITGEELEKMNHLELRKRIKKTNIFARVIPEQKLLIVNALKANNEIVTMTGDGVNDAPALKSAHVGIAMGERGTDVAREASSLVLLNDDFSSIITAVRLGRRIFDNIKRAMGYILAVHIPIAGISILPLFFDLPIILLPAHIAFLELIIDPACSVVFESAKEDKQIMNRPPRNLHHSIFNFKTVSINILQGLGILLAIFLLFLFTIKSGMGEYEARSFAFTSLVLANIALIITNLSWEKNIYQILRSANKTLFIIIGSALICLLGILYIPFLNNIFHLVPLHLNDLALVGLIVFVSLAWFEIFKYYKYKLNLNNYLSNKIKNLNI